MFTQIINPINNKSYSIFSKNGKQLLKQYVKEFNGGDAWDDWGRQAAELEKTNDDASPSLSVKEYLEKYKKDENRCQSDECIRDIENRYSTYGPPIQKNKYESCCPKLYGDINEPLSAQEQRKTNTMFENCMKKKNFLPIGFKKKIRKRIKEYKKCKNKIKNKTISDPGDEL